MGGCGINEIQYPPPIKDPPKQSRITTSKNEWLVGMESYRCRGAKIPKKNVDCRQNEKWAAKTHYETDVQV